MPGRGSRKLERALADLRAALDATGAPWMCIGGIAVIAHGVKRNTHDVDAAVRGDAADPARLVRTFAAHDIVPRIPDAVAFAQANLVLLMQHEPTGVDIDLSFSWLSFEHEALSHPSEGVYGSVRAPIARPEDLMIYKVVAGRPIDLQDAESLLLLHRRSMNLRRVKRSVAELDAIEGTGNRKLILDQLLRRTEDRRRPSTRKGR